MVLKFIVEEVEDYLVCIYYVGFMELIIDVLVELYRCYILVVLFENLSVYGKEMIMLFKDWLFDKVV